mgnify:CR=1 FL=1
MNDIKTQEYSKTVYKKDTSGKIRMLHVYTEGSTLIQESGLVDGEKVKHESVAKPKNIGKSNETTPEEQARLEAASKIETKMSTGYFNTIEEAENNEVILPMLAKDYKKESKKVIFPCYVQPKLDGMRAHGKKDKSMMSRKGKEIETMAHIQADLDALPCIDILDGELYAHGESFQENMKLIKKYRAGESEKVQYHVYDMVYPNMGFYSRYLILKGLVENSPNIHLVPTYKIENEIELKAMHQKFLADGYEGTIVRWGDAGYKINGRSSNLLKYKDFIDIACKVIDIKPSDKRPEQGECVCEHNGRTFGTGMKFSHKEREEILANKENYVGQIAEIRFFEYTDDGTPRFPVCVGFRLDK